MNQKLPISVNNLLSWSEKIILDSGRSSRRLREFILDFNIREYCRFYDEMMPHVKELEHIDEEIFATHVTRFETNRAFMQEAMRERGLLTWLGDTYMEFFFRGRSSDDLVAVIKDIRSNLENLHYSLKIYAS